MRTTLALLALAGCGTQEGSEKGDLDDTGADPCEYPAEVELGVDEVSPSGFSGQDILDWLAAGATAPLSWSDGAASTITFTFAPGTRGVHFQAYEQNPDASRDCDLADRLYVGVAYTITTADGRLDESGDYVVWSETASDAGLSVNTSGQGGPLDACVNGDGAEQQLTGSFTPTGSSGHLDCEGQSTEEMASW